MNNKILLITRSLSIVIFILTSILSRLCTFGMEKISDYHYRACVMDADVIWTDACFEDDLLESVILESIIDETRNGFYLVGENNKLVTKFVDCRGARVYCPVLDPGDDWVLKHTWRTPYGNGAVFTHNSYYNIEVVAPTGISITEDPSKMIVGDKSNFKCRLEGDFPGFYTPGGGKFIYEYESSDKNIISIKEETIGTKYNNPIKQEISAVGVGTATITVSAYVTNEVYGSNKRYNVGKTSFSVEVVDNLDPTTISLNPQDIFLNVGGYSKIECTLFPSDARTSLEWSSSDNKIVSVDQDGKIHGESRGNAIIEVTTSNGLSAKCYVTVLGDEDYSHIQIGDLYYNLNKPLGTASVVHKLDFVEMDDDEFFNLDESDLNYIQGEITVPTSIFCYDKEYKVVSIGPYAFYNCDLTSIELPIPLYWIHESAFAHTQIKDIVIPDGVKSLGKGCFQNTPLENIKLPNTFKEISDGCFYQTKNLLDIELPEDLETIGNYAFNESGLESIYIPTSVKNLGFGAFAKCKNLKAIYIASDNPYYTIDNNAIYDKDLTKLYCVPSTANEIKFPESVEHIEIAASLCNTNITQLTFPANLISIKESAFSVCTNLANISFNNSLINICDAAFYHCNSLSEIDFPDSLLEIGEIAFADCSKLKTISFGSKLKIIQSEAFDNVKADKIYINAIIPPTIKEDSFSDYSAVLIVPKGRIQAYSKSFGWSNFKTITDEDQSSINQNNIDIPTGDIKVYDITGTFVSNSVNGLNPGIYIIQQNNLVDKIIVR